MMLQAPRNPLSEELKPQNCWGLSFSENTAEGSQVGGVSVPIILFLRHRLRNTDLRGLPLQLDSSQSVSLGSFHLSLCLSFLRCKKVDLMDPRIYTRSALHPKEH